MPVFRLNPHIPNHGTCYCGMVHNALDRVGAMPTMTDNRSCVMTLPRHPDPDKDKKETPFPTSDDNPAKDDKALDEALEESFPASDPVSITTDKSTPADSGDVDATRSKRVPGKPR
jgi:hypothetical protein